MNKIIATCSTAFLPIFTFAQQEAPGIDEQIDKAFKPFSDFFSSVIFFEVFDGVIKTFRENIDWDQVNGGHLYPIEDVSGFVHMMVDEFELNGDYEVEEEGNVVSSVVFSKL